MTPPRLHRAAPWAAVLPPLLALALGADILQTPDGLSYLSDLRDGLDLVHPHHVLYGPLVRLSAALLAPLGADLLRAAQIVGAGAFALILAAAWRLARPRLGGPGAWLAVGLLAALRGLPLYAVRVEVYLPLIAAQAWLLALVLEAAERPALSPRRRLGLGLLLGTSALAHQLGALLALPLLLVAWAPRRQRLQVVAVGGALALAGSAAGYLAVRASFPGEGFVGWLLTYARHGAPEWGSAGHFAPTGLRDLLAGIAAMIAPVPPSLAWPAGLLTAVAVAALVRAARRLGPGARLTAGWLGLQLLFVLWWLPADTDFATVSLWPLWTLGVLAVRLPPRRALRRAAVGLAALLLLVNYGVSLPRLVRLGHAERARLRALAAVMTAAEFAELDYGTRQGLRWYGRSDRLPRPAEPPLSGTGP